jgi:16S rRNA (guanine966-N2)-methyltransferase
MRVTGGELRGRTVRSLRGDRMRPTHDRVRESVFAILADRFAGRDFLDLFAGTGTVGIEALSRGARRAVFVENHAAAAKLIERNLADLDLASRGTVVRGDLPGALIRVPRVGMDIAVAYLDPPYESDAYGAVVAAIVRLGVVAPGGTIVAEHGVKKDLELAATGIVQTDERRYGHTRLTFYRVAPSVPTVGSPG